MSEARVMVVKHRNWYPKGRRVPPAMSERDLIPVEGLNPERLFDKRRQYQCSMMDGFAVIAGCEGTAERITLAEAGKAPLFARHGAAPPAARVGRLREEQCAQIGEARIAHRLAHRHGKLQMEQG